MSATPSALGNESQSAPSVVPIPNFALEVVDEVLSISTLGSIGKYRQRMG